MANPTEREWRDLFVEVPGALGAVLQELFSAVDADSAPRNGRSAPQRQNHTIDDVNDLLWPKFSTEPFAEAIRPLLKPSLRAIADRAGISPGALSEMISGQRGLDAYRLEQVAKAARVSPAYFLEYRQIKVAEAVTRALAERPAAGISAYKAIANRAKA